MWNQSEAEQFIKKAETYGSVLGLESIGALMEELGQVQDKLSVIHVAGTNGKGSVCAMLTNIFVVAGYKTGKYSSPQVFSREEAYQINNINISTLELTMVLKQVKEACERMTSRGLCHPTLFEIETAAAFLWFYQQGCQIVVLETGLGGGTDATNIIEKPLACVITSISMDHMGFLGNDLAQIAKVKAGIIKPGCPVITSMQHPKVLAVLKEVCQEKHCDLLLADKQEAENIRYQGENLVFDIKQIKGISLSLLGRYQVENALCVITAVKQLQNSGFHITKENLLTGLAQTKWPGRFEIISQKPLVVLDGAHNEDAALKLKETLELGFTNQKKIYIIGVLADKEHEKMLCWLLPLAEKVYTITPSSPRALSGELLCQEALKYHSHAAAAVSIDTAAKLALADANAQANTMVVCFGSLSYLREMKKAIQEEVKL